MGYVYSKALAATDSAAGTKTTMGAAYLVPPGGPFHIHQLKIGKGNVVNAKECSGIITVEVTSVQGTFEYAYGNGSGGATNNAQNGPAEPIDCRIPAPSGATITVSVTDAENAKNVTVSMQFWSGMEQVDSYEIGGAGSDATAATLLSIGTMTVVNKPGRIKQIRFAGSVVADAEAGSGVLTILVPGQPHPQEFVIGNGPGGATLGGAAFADVHDVDIGVGNQIIPVNTVITATLLAAEDLKSATVSLAIA